MAYYPKTNVCLIPVIGIFLLSVIAGCGSPSNQAGRTDGAAKPTATTPSTTTPTPLVF